MPVKISHFLKHIIVSLMLISCHKARTLPSIYTGTSVTLLIPCVLCKQSSDSSYYECLELTTDNGQTIRPDYQLKAGDKIYINKVEEVVTDTRGPWIAVRGHWENEHGEKVNYIYCWSTGKLLNRAPWENNITKNKRDFGSVP